MKSKHIVTVILLIFVLLVISSCKADGDGGADVDAFPALPDKIVIGSNGVETELFCDDEGYDKIMSYIAERVDESDGFTVALLIDHDLESGEHLSCELRESETFVELVYDECQTQNVPMNRSRGVIEAEEYSIKRIFFPLTREHHDSFFIGRDDAYKNSVTLGAIVDKTELVSYVSDLVAQNSASE